MRAIRYHRYVADAWEDVDLADLMSELSDFLLDSGFDGDLEGDDLDALRDAIMDALLEGDLVDEDIMHDLLDNEEERDRFVEGLVRRLEDEGYLRRDQTPEAAAGREGPQGAPSRFALTDKGVDFLSFRSLRQLMGALGRSSFGHHDSRDDATGVEASAASRPYQFGDTFNLDVPTTLLSAVAREGLGMPLDLTYQDLHVFQSENQSRCATVLMLDCSHSMVLYGEDRFTPAKQVALALAHLIRTQFPGDSLRLVLFHDSAEEVPLSGLARVKVGPYHTNTREGLRLAQRLLARERADTRQIVMITDGKPSALTMPDGRIYTNPFGLDPRIVALTLKEVANCRRREITLSTFMLARDPDLQAFVRKVTQIARGKAYFTAPHALGRFVLMDYLAGKKRLIH